ncbi:MAG TPA: hypothetical protein VF488_07855 [Gemmatimonadaceae bacterium]
MADFTYIVILQRVRPVVASRVSATALSRKLASPDRSASSRTAGSANHRRWWVADMEWAIVDWTGLRVVSIESFGGARQWSAMTVPMNIVRALVARIEETAP